MDERFIVVMTQSSGGVLKRRELRSIDANAVVNVIVSSAVAQATLFEVSTMDDEIVVRMMQSDNVVQASLWRAGDDCCYLCSSDPDPDTSEFVDIGWESFPAWCVTDNVDVAIAAIAKFLTTRELDPKSKWHCEYLG